MNDNQSNYSWREWSKYVLLTLERFEKLIRENEDEISVLKENINSYKTDNDILQKELEKKAAKSDLKLIDFKVALITGIITFTATLLATYVFNAIIESIK